ncbi:MAG TPA: ABC transporter substrate-binding protein [Chloroflexota bacterium]|nr:ABC transporter substrate-binding protein [Chloroflexota bacterium]
MAGPLTLKTAIGSYPHTRPLKDGTVTSQRLCLDHVEVTPANRAFRPMVNQLAYDVSELALVTLILAKALDKQLVGVPVVLMQQSAYGMFAVPHASRLRDPRQLAGCTVGVRAYSQTTGVWLRGMLHDQFGLDLDSLHWVTIEPAHVDGVADPPNARRAPDGANLVDLLRRGEIDAAAGIELAQYPDLRTLIPDAEQVEAEWIRHTGIRPINHTLVVRQDVASEHPWVSDELFGLVRAAKRAAGSPAPVDGLEVNRGPLTLLARYAYEQHITPRTLTAEELFSGT